MFSITMMILSTTLAAAAPETPAARIPELKFEKYTLPNGLDVILHEDHSTPIVGVNIWYHVGSKNERPGRTGFAHLFEHMMFQGSKHYDKSYFGPLQTVGGRLNGSTAMDRTNYWETVPSNYLELALWMESDRMGFLLPAMGQAKLDNQRDVVKNERRQSYENRPYGLVWETIVAAMYPPDHPYSWSTIGSMKDINAASREDIADFFRRYYHPGNASLCIAGDFRPDEAKQWVAKYFGSLPAGPKAEPLKSWIPEVKEEKRIQMTDRVGLARVYIVWPSVCEFTQEDADLQVLAHVLAGGKTSRLYRALVHDKQIAQDVQAHQQGLEIAGQWMLVVTARPGHTLKEIETAIAEEIARIQAEPPSAEEVERAVNTFEAQAVRALEPISEFGGRADRLNMYNVLTGDPGYLGKDFGRYLRVDPQAVYAAAKKFLGQGRVVLEVEPGAKLTISPDPRQPADAARDAMAKNLPKSPPFPAEVAAAERGGLPEGAKEPGFHLPPIQRGRLSNGMGLLLVEKRELPLVNLHVVFPTGRFQDPLGKPGMAELMGAVWDEGTAKRSAEQIATELANMGATLHLAVEWDTMSVRLFTLKRQLAKALDVYADVLRNPTFPQDELDRQRGIALGRLAQIRNEPVLLAAMAVGQTLYGPGHPYGEPPFGSPSALERTSREDLRGFHRGHARADRATMIAVGDITLAELVREMERFFGDWRSDGAKPASGQFPPIPEAKPTSILLIDKPGAAQSVIQVALMGTVRTSPDYFPLWLMNTVFGGQFSSRLNLNLREAKGYTYGARSAFDWRVYQPGPFTATASVQTAVTAKALVEFLKEIDGMVGGRPIEPKELEFCRKYITRGYPAGFETPNQLATQLETLVTFRLPDDYFNTVLPGINAVKGEDIERVAKKFLRPDRLSIIIVGDRAAIEADLRKLPAGKNLSAFQFDQDFRLVPAKQISLDSRLWEYHAEKNMAFARSTAVPFLIKRYHHTPSILDFAG